MKERLDVLVVSRGLAPSREKAKAIIMAGNVLVDGQREDKAGSMLSTQYFPLAPFFSLRYNKYMTKSYRKSKKGHRYERI